MAGAMTVARAAPRADQARILATALEVYCARHGLAKWRVGVLLFKGCRSGIPKLRRTRYPTERVLTRVRSFLAAAPPPGLHRRPLGGPRIRRDCSTGAHLAARLEALIAEHGLSTRRVTMHLFKSPHGFNRLREHKPQRRTALKVEAFLANPPIDALRGSPQAELARLPILPSGRRPPRRLTFEQQLALVAAGKARIVAVQPIRKCNPDVTLGGVSASML